MKKFLFSLITFAVVVLFASCEKDPVTKPDPNPPPPSVVVEFQLDFSAKPENMTLSFGSSGIIMLNSNNTEAIMTVPPTLPITTFRLTGYEAAKIVGKKIYIYIDGARWYNVPQVAASWIIVKAVNPVVALPAVNKLVIPIEADLSTPCEIRDP